MVAQALCRIAGLKALPTDEEIATTPHGNAGTYLLHLATDDPNALERLKQTRAAQWGSPPLQQPLERCVEHLIHILIVVIQGGLQRLSIDELSLTDRQTRKGFIKLTGTGNTFTGIQT